MPLGYREGQLSPLDPLTTVLKTRAMGSRQFSTVATSDNLTTQIRITGSKWRFHTIFKYCDRRQLIGAQLSRMPLLWSIQYRSSPSVKTTASKQGVCIQGKKHQGNTQIGTNKEIFVTLFEQPIFLFSRKRNNENPRRTKLI